MRWPTLTTAPQRDVAARIFHVIHPFHPWRGQPFELVAYKSAWGEDRVYFYNHEQQLIALPASWTDVIAVDPFVAPNAIATVVGTRSLRPSVAVGMAAVFNLLGALSGTAVATSIGTRIVDAGAVNLTAMAAAMIAIIAWSSAAARWGIPTSETHAVVAGLAGPQRPRPVLPSFSCRGG